MLSLFDLVLLLDGVGRIRFRNFGDIDDLDVLEVSFYDLSDLACKLHYSIKVHRVSLDGNYPLVTLFDPYDLNRDLVSFVQSVINKGVSA